ncbi:MAG: nucleotide exchange factor GrpE [Armatimonadetes bacterium]|nr:nucleotide exchange factor GrpE [Armatimonadota bacterium]
MTSENNTYEPQYTPDEAVKEEQEENSAAEMTVDPIAEAQARIAELEKSLVYLQSDFHNYRRRKEEDFIAQQKYIAGQLLKDLLPILDNFERALQFAEQTQSFEKLVSGVQGTQKQLATFLTKAGITPIEALGQEFDPTYHEAIGHTADSDQPENTITEELQKGYLLHGRVLRPTVVKVAGG